jgi:hypothetical protein
MAVSYVQYVTKQDLTLTDYDAPWVDWGRPYIRLPAGSPAGLRIETMADGRVYYTVYVRQDGRLYSATTMVSNGKAQPGVGAQFCHTDVASGR